MLSDMMRLGEEEHALYRGHGVARRRCGVSMESEEVSDESVVRRVRAVAPRDPFPGRAFASRATVHKSDSRSEPRLETRVQSRTRRYGDSSNFVGLPRKRHKIPPRSSKPPLYWSSKPSDEASTSYNSER